MSNEQKMRDAFDRLAKQGHMIGWNDFQTGWESAEQALAAPAGEQVGLTEGGLLAALNDAAKSLATISNLAGKDDFLETMLDVRGYARSRASVARTAIAAHEAKRVSCSQIEKKSTHEVGRVDETGKSEHVGGAA